MIVDEMSLALLSWLEFAGVTVVIAFSGYYLCVYGDILAEKTGMGRTWVGTVLIAAITSLPELGAGISAVTVAEAPDLAVGTVMGSCTFNLSIVCWLDLLSRSQPFFVRTSRGHLLSAGFGILLIGLAGLAILFAHFGIEIAVLHLGAASFVLTAVYLAAMHQIYQYENRTDVAGNPAEGPTKKYGHLSLRRVVLRFSFASMFVIACGAFLPLIGKQLVTAMAWQESFVGTIFLAFSTSLPEAAVTISACVLGAYDLALGNLLGSNLFNILVLAIDDLFFTKGSIYAGVSTFHAATALSACVMTGVVILGLFLRPARRLVGITTWVGAALLALYGLNAWIIYGTP